MLCGCHIALNYPIQSSSICELKIDGHQGKGAEIRIKLGQRGSMQFTYCVCTDDLISHVELKNKTALVVGPGLKPLDLFI